MKAKRSLLSIGFIVLLAVFAVVMVRNSWRTTVVPYDDRVGVYKVPEYGLIDRPKLEWESDYQSLRGEENLPPEQYEVIGYSVEGREIRGYRYGTGDTKLLYVGAIHGGYEWNTALLMYELLDVLESQPHVIPDDVQVLVVPVLNPDGLHRIVEIAERFSPDDAPQFLYATEITDKEALEYGRFNARDIDLNRNFDCEWEPIAVWLHYPVNPGTGPFTEPESIALRDYVLQEQPAAAVFYHSAVPGGGVYGSSCGGVRADGMSTLAQVYGDAAGYPQHEDFAYYAVSGDPGDWLATIDIPAIRIQLPTHTTVDADNNLRAIRAVMNHYATQ